MDSSLKRYKVDKLDALEPAIRLFLACGERVTRWRPYNSRYHTVGGGTEHMFRFFLAQGGGSGYSVRLRWKRWTYAGRGVERHAKPGSCIESIAMDAIAKYAAMRDRGATPNEVWKAALADNLVWIERIRTVRRVFDLSLAEAKEVGIVAMGLADSLSDYQARFIPVIEQLALEDESHTYPES